MGGWFLEAPLVPASVSTPRVLCVTFPDGVEGFYSPCGSILGDRGDISAKTLPEAQFLSWQFGSWGGYSQGWQLPGTTSLVQLPAWAVSPPGECGGGRLGWGMCVENLQDP